MNTLLTRLLSELEVPHTKDFSDKLYNEHPYCYTMYGLQQMLSRYKIETSAIRIHNKKDILSLDTPFLAEAFDDIVIIKQITKGNDIIYDWYGKKQKASFNTFEKASKGIIMQAIPNEKSIEPQYKQHKRDLLIGRIEYIGIAIILLSLLMYTFLTSTHMELNFIACLFSFIILSSIGASLSYLIIRKSLDFDSAIADKICQMAKKPKCNNLLNSQASKFMGRYGWGQIGLGYFSVSIIALMMHPELIHTISFYALCGLLFPLWSLWYQKTHTKNWCALCLCVLSVLSLQGILGYWGLQNAQFPIDAKTAKEFMLLGMEYVLAILSIYHVCKIVDKNRKKELLEHQLAQIKFNPIVIDTFLKQEVQYDCSEATSRIVFGNKNTPCKLTILSNPYCQPCAEMHKYMQQLLDAGCQIQYVFNYFAEKFSDVNKLLIATYFEYGEQRAWKVFTEWYAGGKDKQANFFEKSLNPNATNVNEEYYKHEMWRKETGFLATPTLLLNGRLLPHVYSVKDVAFMIENGIYPI